MAKFFIRRPIFAWVIAITIMLGGLLAIFTLSISQYPDIAPTTVRINASYRGASAETVEKSVTTLIEDGMTGLDDLTYMTSTSSTGSASISLTFGTSIDPDIAQVQVQNKLQLVQSQLPGDVIDAGISVTRSTSSILLVGSLVSTDGKRTSVDLGNIMSTSIEDQIQRLEGNKKALAECPNVKVLEDQTANWSRAEAQTLMENWLTSHPNQINGIIGQNDEMALGAIEAIKAAGLDVKSFAIAGIDGVTDALRAAKAGEMTSILQDARAQAQGALDLAIFNAKKGDYKPESDIWTTYKDMPWNDGKDKTYNVPWTPVTAENVDKLLSTRK